MGVSTYLICYWANNQSQPASKAHGKELSGGLQLVKPGGYRNDFRAKTLVTSCFSPSLVSLFSLFLFFPFSLSNNNKIIFQTFQNRLLTFCYNSVASDAT